MTVSTSPASPRPADQSVQIHLQDLVKTFHHNSIQVEVLRGVNLSIRRGDSLAIVGASGVGKSTLLHIIGTLERPSAGKLLWDDDDVFSLDDVRLAAFRNRKVGFVFQFHHLLPEFNALENVMMPALIARRPQSEARDRAEAMLRQVGMAHRLTHRVSTLSGGEQQRVAVARALVLEPEVILADEPTGNLDPRIGGQIHDLFMQLNHEKGLTTVVVTHNLELAARLAQRVTLRDGMVVTLDKDSM